MHSWEYKLYKFYFFEQLLQIPRLIWFGPPVRSDAQQWLRQTQNTSKRIRKYTVLREDLFTYIEDSAKHPEKYVTAHAEFSTVKYTGACANPTAQNRISFHSSRRLPSLARTGIRNYPRCINHTTSHAAIVTP